MTDRTTVKIANNVLFSEVEKLLEEGHSVTLKAQGNSMFPFITNERDSVVLYPVDRLEKGDIVLARLAGNRYVLHRIQKIMQEDLVLMGDGNIHADSPPCSVHSVIGKARCIIRNGQRIDCNSLIERCKFRIWSFLKPLRRYLLAFWRRYKKSRP